MKRQLSSLLVSPLPLLVSPSPNLVQYWGGEAGRLIASAALIGAGALVEPELLGGVLLGAGIMYGLPVAGRIVRAAATAVVRLSYSAAGSVSSVVNEPRRQVEGIVADARSEQKGS
jgi:hypothetical protein